MRYRHWKDRRGVPITKGAKVAYNMSGDVVPGEVVQVCSGHVKIKLLLASKYGSAAVHRIPPKPHISQVKRPGSVLVLVAGEEA
jgi:hypothetical protein